MQRELAGIYQALLLMSILWKKNEFYKGKSHCEAVVIAAWCLGQIPGGVFKAIKRHIMSLKNYIHGLRSHTSSQTTCFSQLIYQLLGEHNTTYGRISYPIAFVVGRLALWRDIYPCNITLALKYTPTNHRKTSLQ